MDLNQLRKTKDFAKISQHPSEMFHFIIDVFNEEPKLIIKTKTCGHEDEHQTELITRRGRQSILCIDNAENVMNNDLDEFKKFLDQLLESCKYLKVVVTTRQTAGLKMDRTLIVNGLSIDESVDLFLQRTENDLRNRIDEVVRLVKKQSDFEINKILLDVSSVEEMTEAHEK